MKLRSMPAWVVAFLCVLVASQSLATTVQSFPVAFLPSNGFNFDAVVEGTEVVHEFVIQNKGTAPLNISKVQTS